MFEYMFDSVSKHPPTDSVKRLTDVVSVDPMSSHRLIRRINPTFAGTIKR